jgi:hypothetical protein
MYLTARDNSIKAAYYIRDIAQLLSSISLLFS